MNDHIDRRLRVGSGRRDLTERFGDNVRLLRARSQISQETLAHRADIHRTHVSLIEAGSRLPRLDTLLKLAAALDVELSDLLEGIVYRCSAYTPAPGEFEITPAEPPRRRAS